MGSETLTQLTRHTSTAHDELTASVHKLAAAADPLEGRFNGSARGAFDRFKYGADEIANRLNLALASVLAGVDGQNVSFLEGEQEMSDQTNAAYAGSSSAGGNPFSSSGRKA